MSKRDKLFEKLSRKPAPKDFRWDELVTLAKHFGFTESCSGGSHYIFQHVDGYTFTMSKTHPGGILKKYQVDNALDAFARVGQR